ncbi:hypothetical protein [Xanthomonas hydrangeae]|uniref:hypothetical protein n=1 Tax=Xanthomonas hydrangeae TaxID=2775159 RepID=UPI0019650126
MLKLFPMFGALFGLVLGWFLRNRPLAPLDGHDLAIVSKKVEAEPDVFAWVVEAVKRGDTLRERDYAYIARAYNAIVVASAEDDRCAFMEIERAAAIAEISVTRRVGAE